MQLLVEYMGWAIAAIAGVFAFKTSVKFDVNEWLKDRRERKEEALRLLCPHVEFDRLENGQLVIRSRYISPPGTLVWTCQDCGKQTYDGAEVERVGDYWAKHPKEFFERIEEMRRHAKRLGRG